MLLIANGSFKSGTTWIYNILKDLTQFSPPPCDYLNSDWINPSIHPKLVRKLLKAENFQDNSYLAKNHLSPMRFRNLLLQNSQVFIVHSDRDLRDVVVSAYFHDCSKLGYTDDFQKYYWELGRFRALYWHQYNQGWRLPVHERVFTLTFEELKEDANLQVRKMTDFLSLDVNDDQIASVLEETSIPALRKRYEKYGSGATGSGHFRRGEVGSWIDYFDLEMEQDLIEVVKNGLPCLERLKNKIRLKRLTGKNTSVPFSVVLTLNCIIESRLLCPNSFVL